MIIGTAGHIDHGKTALVRALTGVDTDRLPEERRRGISIELGFAPLVLDDGARVSVVDVPGHERFVSTMIAGASGLDAALLVVAINEGVMPQTREHCAILRALGVPVVAVALTKVDRVSSATAPSASDRVRRALPSLGVAPDVPTSLVTTPVEKGVDDVRAALTSGTARLHPRNPDDLFRFIVDRAFTVRGTGTVVTGTVWSGAAAVGMRVRALPGDRDWRVRAVQSHGHEVSRATAGSRFALAVADALPADLPRGTTLVTDDAWSATRGLVVCADAPAKSLPRRVDVQLGGTRASASWSAAGDDQRVLRLTLDKPLVARRGDRIILRTCAGAEGISGATILDPLAGRVAAPLDLSPEACLAQLALSAGARGVPRGELPIRLGVPPRDAACSASHTDFVTAGARVFHRVAVDELVNRVVSIAEREALEHPFDEGVAVAHVRGTLRQLCGAAESAVDAAISVGVSAGLFAIRGDRIGAVQPSLPSEAAAFLGRIEHWIAQSALEGRSHAGVLDAFGPHADGVLRYGERNGNLIRLGGVRYCIAAAVEEAVARLRAAMLPGRAYSPSELRAVLGVSRKYLIPLLEYCDATRVTVRYSGGHVLADVSSR